MPFLITQKLLQQTVTQIDAEERVERYNTLKEELNNETLPLLFKELSCHFRITDLDGKEATSSFAEAMKEKLFQSMKPVGVNFDRFQFIHRMNSEQKQAIRDLFKQVRHFDGKLVDEWFARIQHLTDEIYTVKNGSNTALRMSR
ncbi:hypothetical protein DI43_10545 [Geobacillus sp. CAMR12739]|nr:hypothetical protein DI43_10545 [Geobacillus sp. CAMR12739]